MIPDSFKRPRLWLLILSAVPLMFALRWVAINSPVSKSEYYVDAAWIDDRFVVVQCVYHPMRAGAWKKYESVFRDYLVDCQTGTRVELVGEVSRPDHYCRVPWIAPNRSIIRLVPTDASWKLQRINPQTLDSRIDFLDRTQPVLVGDRYLISQDWDSVADRVVLLLRDVLTDDMPVSVFPFSSHGANPQPVEGADAFLLEISNPFADLNDQEIDSSLAETPSLAPLMNQGTLRPPPLPVFKDDINMMLLYSVDGEGAKLVASWPVVGGSGLVTTQISGGYVTSLRIDATAIDVRRGNTGEIVRSIPIPYNALPARCRPDWSLNGRTLTLFANNGAPMETFDLASGAVIPTEGTWRGFVYTQTENRYLTAADADPKNPADWPIAIQVRDLSNGKVLNSIQTIEVGSALQFTENGSRVKFVDSRGAPVFADAVSGKIIRRVAPTRWHAWIAAGIGIAVATWGLQFFLYCHRRRIPVLFCAVFFTGAILSFCVYRLRVSGNDQIFDRLAWQVIFAIAFAWGLAMALWIVHARIRFAYRLLGCCIVLAIYYAVSSYLLDTWAYKITVVYVVFAALLLLTWSIVVRCFDRLEMFPFGLPPADDTRTMSLRSLFAWTTLAATIVGCSVRIDWQDFQRLLTLSRLFSLSIDCSLCFLVATTTWWGMRRLKWRAFALPVSVTFAIGTRAFVCSDGIAFIYSHDPWWYRYFEEELWYASFKFLPLAGIVALGVASARKLALTNAAMS